MIINPVSIIVIAVVDGCNGAHWGTFKQNLGGCVHGGGYRLFSAVLHGIPWGVSWEECCANMPVPHIVGDSPSFQVCSGGTPWKCEKGWGGMWGNILACC